MASGYEKAAFGAEPGGRWSAPRRRRRRRAQAWIDRLILVCAMAVYFVMISVLVRFLFA